jgi:hypothetical protein
MQTIDVNRHYPEPPEVIFARLSDHERFISDEGVRCKVTKPGEGDRNGLGALREVWVGPLHFAERIVEWNPPHSYGYRIETLRSGPRTLPVDHHGGRIECRADGGGTTVRWTSIFHVRIPLIGGLIEKAVVSKFTAAFRAALAKAARG